MKRLSASLALAALALTAGCGGTVHTATKPSSTPTPGPSSFIAWARTQPNFGVKNLAAGTDDQILNIGSIACNAFPDLSFGQIVELLAGPRVGVYPTLAQATALTREAVVNMCPQYKGDLP